MKGLTGTRLGIIFQTLSAITLGLILGFTASWQITIVILCFFPLLMLSMKMRAKRTKKDSENFSELGARVRRFVILSLNILFLSFEF